MKQTIGSAVTQIGSIAASGDQRLVELAGRGDHEAFAALVEPRLANAFRMASAILGDNAEAYDAVQDAFVSAWVHLPRLRDVDRFDAWLTRIIRNRCRDALRHRRRLREIRLDDARQVVGEDEYFDMAALNGAFERLSVDDRQLLALHHLGHRSVAELASQLGIPVGTAKWRLHKARQALESALEVER